MKKTIMIVSIAVLCIFSLLFIGCNSTNASSTAVTSGGGTVNSGDSTFSFNGTLATENVSTPVTYTQSAFNLLFDFTLTLTSGDVHVWLTNPAGVSIFSQHYNIPNTYTYSNLFASSVPGTYTFHMINSSTPTGTYSVTFTQTY